MQKCFLGGRRVKFQTLFSKWPLSSVYLLLCSAFPLEVMWRKEGWETCIRSLVSNSQWRCEEKVQSVHCSVFPLQQDKKQFVWSQVRDLRVFEHHQLRSTNIVDWSVVGSRVYKLWSPGYVHQSSSRWDYYWWCSVLQFARLDDEERIDPMVRIFPKVTKCTFQNFGVSGTIQQ